MKTMRKDVLLVVWMLVFAGLTIDYVATSELIGIALIIFFAFLGIMVGLGFILKKTGRQRIEQTIEVSAVTPRSAD